MSDKEKIPPLKQEESTGEGWCSPEFTSGCIVEGENEKNTPADE